MSYWALNAFFLGAVALAGIAAAITLRARRARVHGSCVVSAALTVGVLLVMTAVFDNVMIGIGLVGYDSGKISGVFVGIAPLEDFAYAVAALVLLPSLWVLLERRPR
ncbi:lycopene cyclase domain-containing protein [Frondihabitans sp. PhB188]|uniref:lycopene cyclase domain-containing protein n=1 Tax=Frondihabitans sp. PhB188 TaxID=2485200 RepID=UPI000F479C3C|nr:lycopene cyclase domain-containing protein [Frondihabitans sp. PhB188]ROQ39982.1 lycopene cyclase domain-containing protein [Frondihabitans sp. PhB188]